MECLINEKILKNSLVKIGNTSKLKEVLKKKKIKIAFLGGSITEGFNSSEYAKCYAHRTYLWFKNKFNKSEVEYINAGIGATELLVKSSEKCLHEIKIGMIDFNEESIVNILGFLVS